MVPGLTGELIAEFFGTFIVILFGVGVVAQVVAGEIGGHDSIAWSWGLGVTMGIYVAARISGAHLNPAVSIALAVFSGFSWKKVAPYVVAQTAAPSWRPFGAAELQRVIPKVDPGPPSRPMALDPAGQRTSPVSDLGWAARPDHRDHDPGLRHLRADRTPQLLAAGDLAPVVIGLLVVAIGMAWGTDAGYAISPAATLGHVGRI